MAEQIKVPGVGQVKKQYVYAGVALVAGIVGYAWWKNSQVPAGAAVEAAPEGEYLPSGSVTQAGAGEFQGGNTQYATGTDSTTSTTEQAKTNEDWVEQAVTVLLNAGWNSGVAYQAIYKYLGKQALTQQEQDAIRWVLGVIGKPPVGSYSIITETPSTTTPPGNANEALPAPTGFSVKTITETTVTLQWNAVTKATSYNIYLGSTKIYNKSGTTLFIESLKANTSYGPYYVTAIDSSGKESPKSAALNIKTKAASSGGSTGGVPAHYSYTVVRNDTLAGIAAKTNAKYKLKNTWQDIYNFNLKYRSSSAAAKIRQRGPNLTYAGSTWWIPK